MFSPTDRIEKQIVLDSPRSRVWRAITDVREFNQWFGVALTTPFAPGAVVSGYMTMPGHESLLMTAWVETMEPEQQLQRIRNYVVALKGTLPFTSPLTSPQTGPCLR